MPNPPLQQATEQPYAQEKSSRFTALMDAAPDAIIVIDCHGLIQEFNPTARRLFGYALDEVLQQNVKMLMPSPWAQEHDDYLLRYQKTGEARIVGIGREVQARRKDGSLFDIDLSVGEFKENGATFFVGILRDIRERKEARELRQRLTHVARLSMLGEMASGIAHEINQPLTAIATYAQAARRMQERGNGAELGDVLEKIVSQAERAAAILYQLRSFVRRQEPTQEKVQVSELVHSVIQFSQIDAGRRKIAIQPQLQESPATLLVDKVQVQQVLVNLLLNAMDASLETEARHPVVLRVRKAPNNSVCFEVMDQGCGISKENTERLFAPFFTTKSSGIGVGLSICRSIVQAHGGQLQYRPNPEGGSIFEFSLPAVPE